MDDARFWDIIEAAGCPAPEDPETQRDAVRRRLEVLPPGELAAFHAKFNRKMDSAYRWDLWAAAYLINGGASDDGFAYFRAWLISRGRAVFESALRDPDTLATVVDLDRDDHEFEDLWGLAPELYEAATGSDIPPEDGGPIEPGGERWDFDDDEQLARRLPRLAAMYA